jgi:hypothetical protein
MRALTLLAALPVTLGGVLAAGGGVAFADAPVCTFSTTLAGSTTSCVTTTTVNSLSPAQTGTLYQVDDGSNAAKYCIEQLGSDQDGSRYGGYIADAAQFVMVTTTATTTVYKGRSTKADSKNVSTSTVTAGPTLAEPIVLAAGNIECHAAGRG